MPSLFESLKPVLRQADYGVLAAADERGRVHVFIKLPHQAVQFIEEPLPIRHFLFVFPMPTAPVVGWFFEIADDTQEPLRIAAYLNVLDPVQARNLLRLIHQKVVPLHYVDGDGPSIVSTKGISPPPDVIEIFQEAVAYVGRVRLNRYDFGRAKAAFVTEHPLAEIATWRPYRP
ncbi:MAG: hypothetical protein HY204_08740 [Nitrospirae bacterium]|nr:hypothetical protein [Nitrospirota bacterium]